MTIMGYNYVIGGRGCRIYSVAFWGDYGYRIIMKILGCNWDVTGKYNLRKKFEEVVVEYILLLFGGRGL